MQQRNGGKGLPSYTKLSSMTRFPSQKKAGGWQPEGEKKVDEDEENDERLLPPHFRFLSLPPSCHLGRETVFLLLPSCGPSPFLVVVVVA